MTYENAMRWYSYDPFATRARESCTVGALKAEMAGHDIAEKSFDTGRFQRTGKGLEVGNLMPTA